MAHRALGLQGLGAPYLVTELITLKLQLIDYPEGLESQSQSTPLLKPATPILLTLCQGPKLTRSGITLDWGPAPRPSYR